MSFQQKRRTQTEEYWHSEFEVHREDVEHLYEWLVEEGEPRPLDALVLKVMERRIQREELALAKGGKGAVYQPQDKFEVGQKLVFPAFDYAAGQVLAVRQGDNPRYGMFSVIQVLLEKETSPREFAAELIPDHVLKKSVAQFEEIEGVLPAKQVYELYGQVVHPRVEQALQENEDFVQFDGQWFLKGLLPEVTQFHLNLAEALIDERHSPLTVAQMLDEVGVPAAAKAQSRAYALGLAMSKDPRFAKTGTGEEATWFLGSLIPAGVRDTPRRLEVSFRARGGEWLSRELLDFVSEVGDQADELPSTPVVPPGSVNSVTFFLSYPHRREGTVPMTARGLSMVDRQPGERFMITFIDKRTGERMSGWVMQTGGYAWGLGDWYRQHALPIGSLIELSRGEDGQSLRVGFEEGKRRSEWVREARIVGGRLTFNMQRKAYACRYDKHQLLEEGNVEDLDKLWQNPGGPSSALFDHLVELFPELAKLSGQGLVNAKTLYSAVNLTRRSGAVPIFAELTKHACFDPVGDGNWVYDETLRKVLYTSPEEMSRRPGSQRQDLIVDRVYAYGAPSEDKNP